MIQQLSFFDPEQPTDAEIVKAWQDVFAEFCRKEIPNEQD